MSKPLPPASKGEDPSSDDLQARFMTPIGTDQPVNPDPSSGSAFSEVPEVEKIAPAQASQTARSGFRSGGRPERS